MVNPVFIRKEAEWKMQRRWLGVEMSLKDNGCGSEKKKKKKWRRMKGM